MTVVKGKMSSPFKKRERMEKSRITRKNNTRSISDLCEDQIDDYKSTRVFTETDCSSVRDFLKISRQWNFLCGDMLSPHLRPHSLHKGVLKIEASSGIFVEQARFIQQDIVEKITSTFPEIQIRRIWFSVGNFKSSVKPPVAPPSNEEKLTLKERLEKILEERQKNQR